MLDLPEQSLDRRQDHTIRIHRANMPVILSHAERRPEILGSRTDVADAGILGQLAPVTHRHIPDLPQDYLRIRHTKFSLGG
ncbi:MAG: hypothetical protein ACUVSM_05355, partial [Armatimonadota bacterium]